MRTLPVGPRALLIELDGQSAVLNLYAQIEQQRKKGWQSSLVDVVPAANTILLDGVNDPEALATELKTWPQSTTSPIVGQLVELATIYDGEDLEEVAHFWGMTREEVVSTHTGTTFSVAFCGFSPGFAYLTGLPDGLSVPRKSSPRPVVPAGSVALAGEYAGIYPRRSPGGWQIIGRTDAVLWDTDREPATLLSPGTRARFIEVKE